jgi:hypothetical protein
VSIDASKALHAIETLSALVTGRNVVSFSVPAADVPAWVEALGAPFAQGLRLRDEATVRLSVAAKVRDVAWIVTSYIPGASIPGVVRQPGGQQSPTLDQLRYLADPDPDEQVCGESTQDAVSGRLRVCDEPLSYGYCSEHGPVGPEAADPDPVPDGLVQTVTTAITAPEGVWE